MKNLSFYIFLFIAVLTQHCSDKTSVITPNQFKGSDIQRIRAAVRAAEGTTHTVTIPARNANGSNLWLLDSAVLLPGNMTMILENCTLQLSDQCRDNMFRSANVGAGIRHPGWIRNLRPPDPQENVMA